MSIAIPTTAGFPYGRAMAARIPNGAKRGPVDPKPSKAKPSKATPPAPVAKADRKTPVCKIPEATQGQIDKALGRIEAAVSARIAIEGKAAKESGKTGMVGAKTADRLDAATKKLTEALGAFRVKFCPSALHDA